MTALLVIYLVGAGIVILGLCRAAAGPSGRRALRDEEVHGA